MAMKKIKKSRSPSMKTRAIKAAKRPIKRKR